MKHLFLDYPTSRLLKDKGFNEKCFAHFIYNGNGFRIKQDETFPNYQDIQAPTHQQVIDWFRENHNIEIGVVNWDNITTKWEYTLSSVVYSNESDLSYDSNYDKLFFETYYQALNEAIKHALKII